jgi:hypothetical protein
MHEAGLVELGFDVVDASGRRRVKLMMPLAARRSSSRCALPRPEPASSISSTVPNAAALVPPVDTSPTGRRSKVRSCPRCLLNFW